MNVKVYNCPICTAPLDLSKSECIKCKSKIYIENTRMLKQADYPIANRYETLYKSLSSETENAKAEYSLGICHLHKQQFSFAQKHFRNAIDQLYENPDVYYYYAIALLNGKRPRLNPHSTIKEAIAQLQQAITEEDKGCYHYLYAILLQDFYEAKHLNYKSSTSAEQFRVAAVFQCHEEDKIEISNYLGGFVNV